MYCSKCGSEYSDDPVFCPCCGNQINTAGSFSVPRENQADNNIPVVTQHKTNGISKKGILAIFLAVVGIISAAIVLITNTNHTNRDPETLATAFVKAYYGLDAKGMVSCWADFVVERFADDLQVSASRREVIKALQKQANQVSGGKRDAQVISVVIDRELSTNYDLFDMYDVSSSEKSRISAVLDLDVTYILDHDADTDYYMEMICFKENNRWYVLDFD